MGPIGGRISGSFVPASQRAEASLACGAASSAAGREPDRSAKSSRPSFCRIRAGSKRCLDATGIREQMFENESLQSTGIFHAGGRLLKRDFERLDQLAVLHAGRTGRFARAAIEAEIQVPAHVRAYIPRRPSDTARMR